MWELDKAAGIMGEAQLGRQLPKEDVDAIVAFLNTLSGSVPEFARTMPELPVYSAADGRPDNQ